MPGCGGPPAASLHAPDVGTVFTGDTVLQGGPDGTVVKTDQGGDTAIDVEWPSIG